MAKEPDSARKQKGGAKIHNAEEFSNYVHAVTIPMKIMMAAIVVFFAGAVAYCVFGKVPVTVSCVAVSEDECICYVKASDRSDIESGDSVEIGGEDYTVSKVSADAITVDESIGSYAREIGSLELGDSVFTVMVEEDVPNGVFTATITKSYLNPLQVLLEG